MIVTERTAPPQSKGGYNFENQQEFLEGLLGEIQQAINERHAPETVREVLRKLSLQAPAAFEREERLMMSVGYAGLQAHREQHRALAKELESFIERAPASNAAIAFELKIFLKAWLARHVNDTDQRFLTYMSSFDASKVPAEESKHWWNIW